MLHKAAPHVLRTLHRSQVELPAGSRVEYKYVIMEEQVRSAEAPGSAGTRALSYSKLFQPAARTCTCSALGRSIATRPQCALPWRRCRTGRARSARMRRASSASATARSRTTRRMCRPFRSRWPLWPGSPAPTASSRSPTWCGLIKSTHPCTVEVQFQPSGQLFGTPHSCMHS